jgi:hypothetical protein
MAPSILRELRLIARRPFHQEQPLQGSELQELDYEGKIDSGRVMRFGLEDLGFAFHLRSVVSRRRVFHASTRLTIQR